MSQLQKSNYRFVLLDNLESQFSNSDFLSESKFGDKSFTRKRVFTLRSLIVIIMILKTSYEREILSFAKKIADDDYNIKNATAGALSQARAKLNPWAFQKLNDVACGTFYREAQYLKWKGYRLVAVDGSTLSLPYSDKIRQEFGYEDYLEQRSGRKKSLARCSLLYDVLNNVTIDGQLGKNSDSEKYLLEKSLDKLGEQDLLVADRGYGFNIVFHWLIQRSIQFCIRVRIGHRKVVQDFVESDQTDAIVELPYTAKLRKELDLSKDQPAMKVRLVKVILNNGTIEVLATSLIDKKTYPTELFKDLYIKRWEVEEAYKLLKSRIDLEAFSGRTVVSIYQDFYAKIFMMTLCSTLSFPIDEKVKKEYSAAKTGNKYDQQINKTTALGHTRDNLINIFIKKIYQLTINFMDTMIEASRDIIRSNRSFHRRKIPKKVRTINYKPL